MQIGEKLTNCRSKTLVCVGENKLANCWRRHRRRGFSLAVRPDHQVLVSKWLQNAREGMWKNSHSVGQYHQVLVRNR